VSWWDDVIDGAKSGLAPESSWALIDAAVHRAAVGLLNSALPTVVRARYTAVRATNWVPIENAAAHVRFALSAADASSALAGAVEETVSDGLAHLAKDTDYARAVNSIRS